MRIFLIPLLIAFIGCSSFVSAGENISHMIQYDWTFKIGSADYGIIKCAKHSDMYADCWGISINSAVYYLGPTLEVLTVLGIGFGILAAIIVGFLALRHKVPPKSLE